MIITTQHNRGDMVAYVTRTDTAYVLELFDVNKKDWEINGEEQEVIAKEAQYHLREFLKRMDILGRLL